MHWSWSSLWPKATEPDPKINYAVAKGRNCPGRFSKKKKMKMKTFPQLGRWSCPTLLQRSPYVSSGSPEKQEKQEGCVCFYLFILRDWLTPCGGLASPKSAASRLETHRRVDVAVRVHKPFAGRIPSSLGVVSLFLLSSTDQASLTHIMEDNLLCSLCWFNVNHI